MALKQKIMLGAVGILSTLGIWKIADCAYKFYTQPPSQNYKLIFEYGEVSKDANVVLESEGGRVYLRSVFHSKHPEEDLLNDYINSDLEKILGGKIRIEKRRFNNN